MPVDIPMTWENLGLIATVGGATGAMGFSIARLICNTAIKAAENNLKAAEKNLTRHKAQISPLQEENDKLRADNERLSKQGNDLQSLQVIEDLRCKVGELEKDLLEAESVKKRMLDAEGELWLMFDPVPPEEYRMPSSLNLKVLTVANNKGGVGKTTLVMYLAAYLQRQGKRVLAIDLDYQGSLTDMMLRVGANPVPINQENRLCQINRLLKVAGIQNWATEVLRGDLNGVHLITCDDTLTQRETKLQLQWLAQQGKPDVRYFLASVLQNDQVLNDFDVVLIDAPPRLTVGTINALVASTHLLVPTKLDGLSTATVGGFLKLTANLRDKLDLGLVSARIVGTMSMQKPLETELSGDEKDQRANIIADDLPKWQGDAHIFKRDIQDLETIRKAAGKSLVGRGTAPLMFDQLGQEVWTWLGC